MKKVRIGLGIGILVTVSALALFGCEKKEDTDVETKMEQENSGEETSVKFEVKDADYTYGDLADKSYHSVNENVDVSLKDLVFPYIDCDTEDAKEANEEIKKLYEEYAAMFEKTLNSKEEEDKNEYYRANFDKTENGDITSIVIITEIGGVGDTFNKYYTYNFNTKTGKKLSYEDVYKEAGLTEENVDDKVGEQLKKFFADVKEEDCPEGMTVQKYIDAAKEQYKKEKDGNKLVYLLDKDKKLNLIFGVEEKPFDGGDIFTKFVIE